MQETVDTQTAKKWRKQVQAIGFRGAVIALLKEHVATIENIEKLRTTIKRLRKYEPDLEIIQQLLRNKHWKHDVEGIIERLPHTNAEPEVLFVFRGGGNVPTIPATDGKKVYFSSGQTLYSDDAITGQVSWRKKHPQKTWQQVLLKNHILYAASGKILYALDKTSGRLLWKFQSTKDLTSPFCSKDHVFIGSYQGTLYALNSQDGQKCWTFNVSKRIDVGNSTWHGLVFAASEQGTVYGIRISDGECVWNFSVSSRIGSIPSVKYGLVVFGAEDYKIYALLANSGQLYWEFMTGGKVHATPHIAGDVVYCGSRDRHLYAIDIEAGKEFWRFKALGYVSSPTVSGNMAYFSTPGRIYAVSTKGHKMRWCFPLGFPVATAPVVEGRKLYTGTVEGQLICIKLEEKLTEQTAARVLKRFMEK